MCWYLQGQCSTPHISEGIVYVLVCRRLIHITAREPVGLRVVFRFDSRGFVLFRKYAIKYYTYIKNIINVNQEWTE